MSVTKIVISSETAGRCVKSEQGFSLPEILVVFFTAAILVVIAVPNSLRQLELYRLETSVSIISNKLMEARMDAIKRNRTSWVRIDKTTKTAQILSTNDSFQTINVGFPERLSSGLILDSTDSVEVSFDSMGRYSAGPQNIVIKETNSNKKKNITISPSGKISAGKMY